MTGSFGCLHLLGRLTPADVRVVPAICWPAANDSANAACESFLEPPVPQDLETLSAWTASASMHAPLSDPTNVLLKVSSWTSSVSSEAYLKLQTHAPAQACVNTHSISQ